MLVGWLEYSANAYSLASDFTFTGVDWNGEALTERASIVLVEANDGSFFQDTDGTVYVNPPTGEDIYSASVQGAVLYTFSKGTPKNFDAKLTGDPCHFESRIQSIPALSLRIEPRFSGVGQVGGGSCDMLNNDGYFDDLADVDWTRASFYMGADRQSSTMAYSDYQAIGSYRVESWKADRSRFTLTLREPKTVLNQSIPVETFTRDEFPNIDQNNIGKIIPRIYGRVFAAQAICIDATAKQFKICGHAVYEITEARIFNDSNVWQSVPFASRDEANGEFTLGAEWENQQVCVDLIGVKDSDGRPMYNWADIVQDILEYLGESDFDTASFAASRAALTIGTYQTGQENTLLKGSLNIAEATSALELISRANNAAGAFLYVNASGQWHFEIFDPVTIDDVTAAYTDADILENSFSASEDMREVYSKVSVNFAERFAENWAQNVVYDREENQRRANFSGPVLKEIDAPLWDERDAQCYAQRILTTDAEPLAKFTFSLKWNGFLRKPGEQIAVTFEGQNIAGVFEILEAKHDLNSNRVTLTCGDRRAWGDSFGFWTDDAAADWNPAGTTTEKREASENAGFWHGDNDLADDTDSASHAVSRWF